MTSKSPPHSARSLETRCIHAGEPRPRPSGALVAPIYQSSTYEYHGEDYHDVGYLRLSNTPSQVSVANKIAALEGAEAALVTSSGMAAISATLMSLASAGDHILAQDCLYGGTQGFLRGELKRFGVEHTAIDPQRPESWAAHLQPTTRLIYVETLTNPLVQVADLEAVVAFAREHGLVSVIDNTFASPVNFRPAERGFDLVMESCTKYMNGHSDLIAGSVAGSAELVHRVKLTLDHLGGALDPHACFLLQRGLKTLAVRVRAQNSSALAIARLLESHPAVARVNYPGLASHAEHARAAALFDGFGGMVSFEMVGGTVAAETLLQAVTLPTVAVSLGGPETLMVRPAAAIHSQFSAEERAASGIADGLIRMSVGLEGTEDLLADFAGALEQVG